MGMTSRLMLLLCSGLWTVSAEADATIELSIRDSASGTDPELQTAYVKEGRVMVRNAGGSDNTDVLFVAGQENFTVISHAERNYITIDKRTVQNVGNKMSTMLAKLKEQMAAQNMSPEQIDKLEEMYSEMLPDQESQPRKEFVDTGDSKSVNGVKCKMYKVLDDGNPAADMCVADRDSLGLSADDYDTLKAMHVFADELAAEAASMMGPMASQIPQLGAKEIDGIPVEISDSSGDTTVETRLVNISTESFAHDLMVIPGDYQPARIAVSTP